MFVYDLAMADIAEVLASVPLFSAVSKKDLGKLAKDVHDRTFPAGTALTDAAGDMWYSTSAPASPESSTPIPAAAAQQVRALACAEVPLLAGATHCFVSATVTRSPHHPVGRLLGDILVLTPSASGRARSRRIPFEAEHGHHVGPAHHFALLNHPEVYERLRGWLEQPGSGSPSQGLPDR